MDEETRGPQAAEELGGFLSRVREPRRRPMVLVHGGVVVVHLHKYLVHDEWHHGILKPFCKRQWEISNG